MTRIEWSRLEGNDIEAVISMLICGRHFEAVRVTPGQGDGGVDVFVPTYTDYASRHVYQVKGFSDRISHSQKRKIKTSLRTAANTARDEGWSIEKWSLAIPLDPTPSELSWFEGITSDFEFPCDWIGLNSIELLAAQNPAVVDYYLRDGKDRLQNHLDGLTSILSNRNNRELGEPLRPDDITTDLVKIYRAINECDPHYRYEISVSQTAPTAGRFEGEPGLVAVSSSGTDDTEWVTIKIFARSLEALKERPISGKLQFLTADEEVAQKYKRFFDLGQPTTLPSGAVVGNVDLPGGIECNFENAAVHIEMADEAPSETEETELLVGMLSPNGELLAELRLIRIHANAIPRGGRRTVWKDSTNFVEVEILANDRPRLTINFSLSIEPQGRIPSEIADSLRFISCLHSPNTPGLSLAYGPRRWSTGVIKEQLPQRDPEAIARAEVAVSLSRIQHYASRRLRFPAAVTHKQAVDIKNAAQILSGEPVEIHWQTPIDIDRTPLHNEPRLTFAVGDPITLRVLEDLTIELDGSKIAVGRQMSILNARVLEVSETALRAEPDPGQTNWRLRYDGDEENYLVSARAVSR